MNFELPRRLLIPPHVLTRRIGRETLLLDLQTSTCLRLDETTSRLWELLASTQDLAITIITFQAEAGVDPELVEEDICSTVQKLLSKNLLDPDDVDDEPELLQ